jgi:formate-dependent phosphoribosylglycinamide formyltransferase (GAR transformylase)
MRKLEPNEIVSIEKDGPKYLVTRVGSMSADLRSLEMDTITVVDKYQITRKITFPREILRGVSAYSLVYHHPKPEETA